MTKRKTIMISICAVLLCICSLFAFIPFNTIGVVKANTRSVGNSTSIVNMINSNDVTLGSGVTLSNGLYYIDTSFYYASASISNNKLGLVANNLYTYFINVNSYSLSDLYVDFALFYADGDAAGFETSSVSIGINYITFTPTKDVNYLEIRFVRQHIEGRHYTAICSDLQIYKGDPNFVMGYVNGYMQGSTDVHASNINSLGLFSSCFFKIGGSSSLNTLPDVNTDISTLSNLPSSYIIPYNSGVYFNGIYGEDIDTIIGAHDVYFILSDFGTNGTSFDMYKNWLLINGKNGVMNSKFEFGTFIKFVFTDNSSAMFNQSDNYFTSIDLSSHVGKNIRFIIFGCVRSDLQLYGMCSNADFTSAYNSGYNDGNNYGYSQGFNAGKNVGYGNGYNDGISNSNNYSFLSLISAVIDAPIKYFQSLFNFDLLGVNLQGFITGLFTLAVIITIIRMVL